MISMFSNPLTIKRASDTDWDWSPYNNEFFSRFTNIIVYLNNLKSDKNSFLKIRHGLTVSILVASGGVACSSEASESPSVHPLATKVVRKPMFFRRSFLSGPPRAKNPPVKKDGYWEGRNRVSKYNTTYWQKIHLQLSDKKTVSKL